MAEAALRADGLTPEPGMKFRHSENHHGFFASVVTEIERRGDQWVVTRLERSRAALPESDLGLRKLA